ncbi:MAG: hypothetical protein AAFN92_08445 [Bacteroidota bacterium]
MRYTVLAFLALLFVACTSDRAQEWPALDLTRHNIPLTIQAPDSAKVNAVSRLGIMQDVTIKSEADDYSIQVLASQATTNDMTRLRAEQLELVRDNRYFESVVREDPDGFIFQNRIDTTAVYGFRYIVYQGDREFVFQNGFDGIFGLPAIEAMYAAVKQQ